MLKNKKKKGTLDFYPIIIKESGVTSIYSYSFRQYNFEKLSKIQLNYIQIPDAKYI